MTPAQKAIKQLQSALVALEIAGKPARVMNIYEDGGKALYIIIPGVTLVDGHLREEQNK
jgi:hypothetical protein